MSSPPISAILGASSTSSPPGLQHARMILQDGEGMGQMLDGVAGMDDVEAGLRERGIFDARQDQLGARQAGAGIGIALVGFDRGDVWLGAASRKAAAKLPRLEPTSSSDKRVVEIGVPRQGVHRRLGAKALAVAHIAPIGAAGYRRVVTRLRSGRCAAGSAPARNGGRDRPSSPRVEPSGW